MRKLYTFFSVIVILLAAIAYNSSATSENELKDGYYTAEAADYRYGWKEFLSIYVNNGRIVMVEYDASNSAGFMKSWDLDYMRLMNKIDGNYPNKYTRNYASELVARQRAEGIDAMSGATDSFHSFKRLAEAAIAQARMGDRKVAFVKIPQEEH
jgi:major membrane immunogen (membrane-anchored lipoprotein)